MINVIYARISVSVHYIFVVKDVGLSLLGWQSLMSSIYKKLGKYFTTSEPTNIHGVVRKQELNPRKKTQIHTHSIKIIDQTGTK